MGFEECEEREECALIQNTCTNAARCPHEPSSCPRKVKACTLRHDFPSQPALSAGTGTAAGSLRSGRSRDLTNSSSLQHGFFICLSFPECLLQELPCSEMEISSVPRQKNRMEGVKYHALPYPKSIQLFLLIVLSLPPAGDCRDHLPTSIKCNQQQERAESLLS